MAHRGVYVAVPGPNLETRAEYRFLRAIGADVVGMSTVPEVLVAVHAGLKVLGFSIVTDLCLPDALEPVRIEEILAVARTAEGKLRIIVRRVLETLDEPSVGSTLCRRERVPEGRVTGSGFETNRPGLPPDRSTETEEMAEEWFAPSGRADDWDGRTTMSTNAKPYKETLNLPATRFEMKANLTVREPRMQDRWRAKDLYGQIREARAGRERKVLHDGPPYANGEIHMGHLLNKVLKDIVVRSLDDAGLRQPVRPRLGLPRPADRAQGRQGPGLEGRRHGRTPRSATSATPRR